MWLQASIDAIAGGGNSEGKADYMLENVIGCGCFQVLFFLISVVLVKANIAFTMMFMSYGNFSPGWRCLDDLDNDTIAYSPNYTSLTTVTNSNDSLSIYRVDENDVSFTEGTCEGHSRCKNVQFNPESSTIVTEWNLVCDRAWIASSIISIQMVGMIVGSYLGGQLADLIGRKKTLYGSVACGAVLQVLSSYSSSLPMFAAMRFFLGAGAISNLVIMYLYIGELMTKNWRATAIALPTWQVGTTILAISAMELKDWRSLELVGCSLYVISLIPAYWVPESLRWLEVKNKDEQFEDTAKQMAKLNSRAITDIKEISFAVTNEKTYDDSKRYTVKDIFRRGYRFYTLAISFLYFSFSLMYYALAFGVKAWYGNFYINLILTTVAEVPFGLVAMVSLRYMSRIRNSVIFLSLFAICVFSTAGINFSESESAKALGSAIFISIGKGCIGVAWYCLYARTSELYPTVVRGVSIGWGSSAARIGGVLAPVLIPNDRGLFFIYMIAMGAVSVFGVVLSVRLPETRGLPLKETFDDAQDDLKLKAEMVELCKGSDNKDASLKA